MNLTAKHAAIIDIKPRFWKSSIICGYGRIRNFMTQFHQKNEIFTLSQLSA